MIRTTPDGQWTYLRSNIVQNQLSRVGSSTTAVTDPQNNQTVIDFTSGGTGLYETQRRVFNGSATGTPIEATITCYNGTTPVTTCPSALASPPFAEVDVYRSLDGGPSSRVDTFYNTSSGVITGKNEYDFGATVPTRKTTTTYDTTLGNGIRDRPSRVTVTDGTGTVLFSQTDYVYDEDQASLQPSGALQRAAVTCTSGFTKCRGNLTTLKKYITGSTTTTETFTHYDTGQVYQATDANGNITTYTYGVCGNSFLTNVAMPMGLSKSSQWDCNGGVQTSATDPNGKVTTYKYVDPVNGPDPFWRRTEVDSPDGGVTTTTYNDTASPPNAVRSQKITATLSATSQTNVDGYGRAVLHKLTSDPEGTTYSATSYDSLGRTYQVSTPYRSTGDSTYGVTTTLYDALGRPTTVTEADNSTITTSYLQNCTTVTDEAGKTRKSCSDGLGKLIGVWEDPTVLNYETDYQYNVRGDLICAVQKGTDTGTFSSCAASSASWRPRSFSYDMLSRLTSASNPESGTIGYTYDANGNVSTRTAPTPNKILADPSAPLTLTTTYSYDALNRPTQKSYSDGTAAVTYGYDGVNPTGCIPPSFTSPPATNLLGRRSGMCDAAGAAAWSYDSMGRAVTEKRLLNTSITKTIGYTYNLDGSLATLLYPSGRTITYGPSGSGQPISATDTANNINYVSWDCPQSGIYCYAPNGAEMRLKYGVATGFTGIITGIITGDTYNKRLQPIMLSAATTGSGGQTVLFFSYDFHLANGDNGNVIQIVNNRDTTRTQNFAYDSLNRIASAQTTSNLWGTSYVIDPWGNLVQKNGIAGKNQTENLTQTASTQNQFVGFCYDRAGNMLGTGGCPALPYNPTYVYDAENRLRSINSTLTPYYTYDGDGKRVVKTYPTINRLYWTGTGSNALTETDLSGNPTADYIYFNGKRVARIDLPGGAVRYYFSDHLRTASVVTDNLGVIKDESDYYPYGGERVITHTDSNRYKFTDKERDAESGLDMYGARYYGSALGRFMTPDWAAKPTNVPYAHFGNPQSLNLYSYVENNPTTTGDPDGHCDICWQIAMYIATHVAQVGTGIQATRQEYNSKVAGQTTVAGRDAVKAEMRGQGPALGRELAQQAAQDPARTAARAAKADAQLPESITRTNTGVNATAEAFGTAGRLAGGVAVGIAVYDVATAPQGQKLATAAEKGGGLGGALAGGEIGAEAGASLGPYGAAGGGILGSIIGGLGLEDAVKEVLAPSEPEPNANGNGATPYHQ